MEGGQKIAGTVVWEKYRPLKFIRDELIHVKRRGLDPDPKKRTAHDRLLVSEADQCVEDAIAVVEGAWPGLPAAPCPSRAYAALSIKLRFSPPTAKYLGVLSPLCAQVTDFVESPAYEKAPPQRAFFISSPVAAPDSR